MTTMTTDKAAADSKAPLYNAFPDSRLARRTLRSMQPSPNVSYEFTEDAGLIHQYCILREQMFIKVWGLQHFCGKKDKFDDVSHIIIGRRGLQVIGGGRLTVSSPAMRRQLPMEGADLNLQALFPELDLQSHTYGEYSRLAILPEFRGGAVFMEGTRRFLRRTVAEGVEFAFNMAPLPLARTYRQALMSMGLNWQIRSDIVVPDREEFEGIKMVISVMDLRRAKKQPTEIKETSAGELTADTAA